MSSRSGWVVALVAVAGLIAFLLLGRGGDAPSDGDASKTEPRGVGAAEPAPRGSWPSAASPVDEALHALRGRVEAGGQPLGGAVVTAVAADEGADEGEGLTARTDANGSFALEGLAPGRYAVSAVAPGHLPAVRRSVDVRDDVSITLVLEPGGHPLRGTVSDATGGTVEGALVRLVPLAGIAALRRLDGFATLSTEDGGYAIHVAPGRYRVEVSHADYATERRTVEVGPGAQSQDFALVPMGVIEGVVREEDGGAPVPGAWVSWQRERQVTIAPGHRMAMTADGGVVRADDEGRFRVRGLAPGAIALLARAPSRASERATVVSLAMAEHVRDADVLVVRAHDLTGRVVAADDAARGIADAEVSLGGDERFGPRTRTDAEGRFVLSGVLAGPATVMATAEGWLPSIPGVAVEVGTDADELVIALERAPAIRGRVEPATVAQVSIELRPETVRMGMGGPTTMVLGRGEAKAETDAEGRFELSPATPGPITVVARAADGRAGEVTVEVGPDGADDVVIRLEERATVRGTVRSTTGEPVAQASVSLRRRRAPGAPQVRLTINGRDMGVDMGTTTEEGRFEIAGIATGDYEVAVVDRHGEPLPLRSGLTVGEDGTGALAVTGAGELDGVDLVVDAHDGVIRGTVRTADGDPVPDAWVQATLLPDALEPEPPPPERDGPSERHEMRMIVDGGGGSGAETRPPVLTDEEGRFEIVGLRDARYELVAEGGGGGRRATAIARPGDEVALALADLGGIEGVVTLDGQPLERFAVRVEGPTSRSRQVRDGGGRFSLDRLEPGTYRLVVTAPDGSGRAEVTVGAGETVTRDVVLEHAVTVRGRILDREGKPIAGAMVMIGDGEAGRLSIERTDDAPPPSTDEEGRFEVTCAAGPRGLLAASPKSPQPLVVRFFVAQPGQDVDLGDLREQEPGGRVMQQGGDEVEP